MSSPSSLAHLRRCPSPHPTEVEAAIPTERVGVGVPPCTSPVERRRLGSASTNTSEFETDASPDLVLVVGHEAHERHVVGVEHSRFTGLPGEMINGSLNRLVRAFPKTTTRGKTDGKEGRSRRIKSARRVIEQTQNVCVFMFS